MIQNDVVSKSKGKEEMAAQCDPQSLHHAHAPHPLSPHLVLKANMFFMPPLFACELSRDFVEL
jgi:hypothetical protein